MYCFPNLSFSVTKGLLFTVQLATNRFVMLILLLITISLIVTVIVKVLPFIFLHNVEPTPSSELTDDYE